MRKTPEIIAECLVTSCADCPAIAEDSRGQCVLRRDERDSSSRARKDTQS